MAKRPEATRLRAQSASARAKAMTDQEYEEMITIVGMAAETNGLVAVASGTRPVIGWPWAITAVEPQ